MSRLPAVRLGSLHKEDPTFHEIEVDFQPPSGSKFGFAWPDGTSSDAQQLSDLPHLESNAGSTASAEEETDFTPTNYLSQEEGTPVQESTSQHSNRDVHLSPTPPRMSRAFSMPLPSQLGHWQHPGRSSSGSGSPTSPAGGVSPSAEQHFDELSLELADSVQMAIQTLLQLSPPQLFDPAKEQFSACAVQIPTPSISALLTSMKNLNYISANMRKFGSPTQSSALSLAPAVEANEEPVPKDEFDIGELMQSVGDSLGGVAAEAGVDLVLHHGDAGIKHMGVKGDECGISYALSHVIHQVLITTRHKDTIEIGLSLTGQSTSHPRPANHADHPASDSPSSPRRSSMSSDGSDSPVLDDEGPIVCTFDIAHKFVSWSVPSPDDPNGEPAENMSKEQRPSDSDTRLEPQFDTAILRRLLKHIGATLRPSLQPKLFRNGRRCELSVMLERGPYLSDIHRRSRQVEDEMSRHNIRLAREPTLEELTTFAETLRGKKVAFHASSLGSFAHHLTRYLTAWGMDISHVPTDGVEEKDPAEDVSNVRADSVYSSNGSSSGLGIGLPTGDAVPPVIDGGSDVTEESKATPGEVRPSFVIIDDDVSVLRHRLLQYRADAMPNLHLHPRKRPSLATNHRPRSSPSIRNTLLGAGVASPLVASSPVPIVHFTSLANYKLVKDAIQAALAAGPVPGVLPFIPEVIVIPKPAGPRRLLTALHTAVNKPVVDPFFTPIATSPMSPSGTMSPFFTGRKSTSVATPASSSSRSGGERPSRSPREAVDSLGPLPPSSPLAVPEGLEYFSDAAVKQLGGNGASGLVIQSPDGRPAGIFFQPQSRSSSFKSDMSTTAMEREKGALKSGSQRTSRRSSARKTSQVSQADPTDADASNNVTPKVGSPAVRPSLTLFGDKFSLSSPVSSWPEQHRSGDHTTELVQPFRGKGRTPSVSSEQEEARAAAWREATKNLANPPQTPQTSFSPNPELRTDVVVQSPTSGSTSLFPIHKTSNSGLPLSMPRSSSSPTSPEAKKSVARRATQGPKSPVVSSSMKKSKTMGNNIVPPISVLIVEDNAINQTILSTFMRRNKIKYEVAWNGREAVEKWRSGNFHLILMDIQMPVMDGIEATKEIRRLEKLESMSHFPPSPAESSRRLSDTSDSRPSSAGSSTPFRSQVIIVALTASSLQSDRVAALAAGCNDFLTKPVTNSWLNDKIIEWGSIKALQMWAELRPEIARNMSHDQNAQAQAVANKLHVPPSSSRKSPLSGEHALSEGEVSGQRELAVDEVQSRQGFVADAPTVQHPSEKDDSDSDSSHDQWPLSSDDEAQQDPITEPPAVIQTPVHRTIDLPGPEPEQEIEQKPPHAVSGESALNHFLEDSRQEGVTRPTILGRRALSSVSTSTSIASVMHDTPGVGGTFTDGLAVADATQETTPEGETDPPPPH